MKQWWVYELRAGDWLYIGQTSNPGGRLKFHRVDIRLQEKPARWDRALQEFPIAEDWEMTVVAGPFPTKEEAISEEERLQRELGQYQGRLWERCGNAYSDEMKERQSGENNPMYGKPSPFKGRTQSVEAKAKMRATLSAKRYTRAFFDWLCNPT